MLTITNESNYLAKPVQLGTPKKHPNADRLQIWNVDGYDVITDLSSKEGDLKIYFPPECQIHHSILSKMNMYSDKDLNADNTQVGYVSKSRRVKAVKLRDVISEGILLPYVEVMNSLGIAYNDLELEGKSFIGQLFDTVDGTVICQKYVPETKEVRSGTGTGIKKKNSVADILVEPFPFHYSTSKLQDNIWKFDNEDDVIVITDKWHGTSAVFSNLLTKRKLSFWEKVKRFFGSNINILEYSKSYSSRSVVKSIEDKYNIPDGGYYNSDIWGKVFDTVKQYLFQGYTIYGEIVGYVGDTKMVQKGYDYGCKPGEHKFLVYRITENNAFTNGQTVEYSWAEILDFCDQHGLEAVPQLYYGTIKHWKEVHNTTGDTLLDALKKVYLEKDCTHCISKVPAEGICIRNESGNKIAYKLKSKRFLLAETEALDKGEEVVE